MNDQNYSFKTYKLPFRLLFIFVLTFSLNSSIYGFEDPPSKYPPIKTVVIDAGHGGKDPGCSGKSCNEKDITLQISKKLGEMISDNFPETNVIYTRDKDEYLSLNKRAYIANSNNADIFISIHCNALARKSNIVGSETYVLGLHNSDANLEIVKRENVFHEGDEEDTNLTSTETHILSSLYQEAMISRSTLLARLVEERLKDYTDRPRSSVKQAGFAVLRKTTMPSILIETGYLTTPEDERLLNSAEGQYTIALAIYNAYVDFQYLFEEEKKETVSITEEIINEQLVEPETIIDEPITETIVSNEVYENKPINVAPTKVSLDDIPLAQTYPMDVVENEPIIEEVVYEEVKPQAVQVAHVTHNPSTGPIYYIQIRSSPFKLGTIKNSFGNKMHCIMKYEKNLYKYIVKPQYTYADAKNTQIELQNQGFKDAFIAVYYNDRRISVTDAIKFQ